MPTTPRTLTTAEAAAFLDLHRASLMRLVADGRLKPAKVAGRLAFDPAELEAYRARKCQQCGKAFAGGRADRVFCSRACAYAAGNARRPAPVRIDRAAARPLDTSNPRLAPALALIHSRKTSP